MSDQGTRAGGEPRTLVVLSYSVVSDITSDCMYVAYVDESGDSGVNGSITYTLGCVLMDGDAWPETFDRMIQFRRFLRDEFGLPVRAEIKANHLLRNAGAFRSLPLSEEARFRIYRGCMRLHDKLGLHAFAVVIEKDEVFKAGSTRPDHVAWEYLLQRLERFTTKGGEVVLLVHDEGDPKTIRTLARKSRRAGTAGSAFGAGWLHRPFVGLLDDPVARRSEQSYFLQLADLDAFAAFRCEHPPPPRRVQIAPQSMWQELGEARFAPVSSVSGGPRGIVRGP